MHNDETSGPTNRAAQQPLPSKRKTTQFGPFVKTPQEYPAGPGHRMRPLRTSFG